MTVPTAQHRFRQLLDSPELVGLIQSNVADWLEWKSQQLEEWKKLSGILLEKQDELAS